MIPNTTNLQSISLKDKFEQYILRRCQPKQAVEQTVALPMIWDNIALMCRQSVSITNVSDNKKWTLNFMVMFWWQIVDWLYYSNGDKDVIVSSRN